MTHLVSRVLFALALVTTSALCLKDSPKPLADLSQSEAGSESQTETQTKNPQIDYDGFQSLVGDVREIRKQRLVPLSKFLEMAKEPHTIILDTRSKSAFEKVHWKGAIHLNFSDFTDAKLASVIPNKQTQILIYCNNNFIEQRVDALKLKQTPLALNVPTFVNLHGYGYEHVYELGDVVSVNDSRIELVRSSVTTERN